MSRLKKFTRSLFSGYLLLGANIFYTLASVPLAWHYLGATEFGLWALVSQISGYIALIDLGMAGSVSRILIDHKDERQNGGYGSIIKTGALVGVVQGVIILLTGLGLSALAGSLLKVPMELRGEFFWLMAGQSALLGLTFACRIFSHVLTAHQRVDVFNYGAAVFFLVNIGAMWAGFAGGLGIYSFLLGQGLMTLGNVVVNFAGCRALGLLPRGREWGRVTAARFRELFDFGRDIFVYSLGSQMINASQTILLTRLLGLETAAVWTVGTRAYLVLTQVIYRLFDFSAPALAEMMVRGEKELLCRRFKQIAVLSANLSLVAGVMFALCNHAFITVWLKHPIAWLDGNDLLLGIWLLLCVTMRTHNNMAGQTKQLRFMRYIFFLEGLMFIGLTLAVYRFGGITAMLCVSILCTACFTLPYGLYRTRQYFSLTHGELAAWFKPSLKLGVWVLPVGLLTWWLTRDLGAWWQLATRAGIFGLWTAWAFLRHGLPAPLQGEIYGRMPAGVKPMLDRIGFAKS